MTGWIVFCVESDMGSICLAFDCDLPFFSVYFLISICFMISLFVWTPLACARPRLLRDECV